MMYNQIYNINVFINIDFISIYIYIENYFLYAHLFIIIDKFLSSETFPNLKKKSKKKNKKKCGGRYF